MSLQALHAARWWELARASLAAEDWAVAEGALRRLIASQAPRPDLLDLLGYSLLMQGDFSRCAAVLLQALRVGSRSFWTPHKLGDALRGLQQPEKAVSFYEQALTWGSDSPLTVRNLLEVLSHQRPDPALQRLETFVAAGRPGESTEAASPLLRWDDPLPWQCGAIEAALRTRGPEIAIWLCRHGCPDPAVRRVVWEEELANLHLPEAFALLGGQSRSPQEQALQDRLDHLLGSAGPCPVVRSGAGSGPYSRRNARPPRP
jgi:tetratricopeptide (TPR) repeat protein